MSDGVDAVQAVTDTEWQGWSVLSDPVPDTFLQALGTVYLRCPAPKKAQVALITRTDHRNRLDSLHGGLIAGFADHAFFAGLLAMGYRDQANAVTIDLTMQYLGAGRVGPVLLADVELLRETGRIIFLRMLMTQDGQPVAASSATLRKASMPR